MAGKYKSILEDIEQQLENRELKPGDMLPTENDYIERYGVSRTTVQRALNILVSRNIIYRVPGKGSFVSEPPAPARLPPAPFAGDNRGAAFSIVLPYRSLTTVGFFMGAQSYLEQHGCTLTIRFTECTYPSEVAIVRSLREAGTDGIILYPYEYIDRSGFYHELAADNLPVVTIDKNIAGVNFSGVTSNNYLGGRLAAEYLLARGHRRLAFLSELFTDGHTLRERYLGFAERLRQFGVGLAREDTVIIDCRREGNGGFHRYLKNWGREHPTAVFCATDEIAALVYRIAYALHYRIPDELSVIGYDDLELSQVLSPPLTTIAQPYEKIGAAAAELLLDIFRQGDGGVICRQLPVKLVERGSVRRIAANGTPGGEAPYAARNPL